ncbi:MULTISPECIES: RagB/SusD family nutrient uptake outer membrane protein [unclassified Spirosoma]|uniref:RagB/SusD family nutrient uptake outer membrane protein n=1 Tax=unclassified Spirosoma TaxID=2621999 RepID=UPI000961341C|nr:MULTISPECIES: RagB/SusD family nutrient uptake outer membrane protein [unclassified Spirosoma]MBN8822026.1 RagB/SusD family nutrient uptake outer membrane protein [Spirosoma sp.]OJW80435.1 MAG: RagB/SusD family nutrient uptake outer membrane protein [Spirosoma sp. 48-14]
MNYIIKCLSFCLLLGVTLVACNQDFLNTKPLDKVSGEAVWSDQALADAFVTDVYNGLRDGILDQMSFDCQTDNALYSFGKQDVNEANVSPSNLGTIKSTMEWSAMYQRIRAANIALANLAKPKFDNSSGVADRMKGEMYFMRGYFYNQLLRYYGGVPIIKNAYTLNEADFGVARNTYEECVNAIVSDLDSAALLLKGKTLAAGRATQGAALALKARVLMYAASDLHDIPTAKIKSSVIASFDKPELLGYVSGDRTARWQKAKDAAKAVIDLNQYGYKLNLTAPVTAAEGQQNYINMYLSRNGGEADGIFLKYYIRASFDDWGSWYPRNNMPNGYHGWTSSEPTQQLVDSYEMMDGTKFDWKNPTHAAAPYENRDPRFYASILYDGAQWKPRTPDGAGIDPAGQIQTGFYEVGTGGGTTTPYAGLDTRNSTIENWNGTWTGYAIRKFMDPDPTLVDMNIRQEVPSIQIRFTEVVLNYAEACLALGQETEAKTWINRVRFRVGMPAITESGSALVARYQNERNIEMLFEDQRFYDVRRWMIAPQALGSQAKIIVITGKLKPGKTVTTYKYNKDNYNYTYSVQDLGTGKENRKWSDKIYFLPISRDEINRNNKLVQNPGYN